MNTYKMKLEDSVGSMIFDLLEVPIVDKDVEGAVDNTTVDGNVFTDYLWLKKNYVQKWSIMCDDEYSQLRGFYTRQFDNASVPTYKLYTGQNLSEDFIASGKYIMVDNTTDYNAPINSFQLLGDAEQTTYSGKNLFDMDAFLTAGGATYTKNGNVFSLTDMGNLYASPQPLNLTSGVTYTFSQVLQTQSSTNVRFDILKDGAVYASCYADQSANLVKTFTADSSTYTIRLNYSTRVYPVLFNSPMLEASATKTAYEPYVGGIASPNPDYPQAVNTVTGEQTVKVIDGDQKNLADPQTFVDWVNNMKGLCQIYGWGNDTTQPQITTYDGKTNVASVDASILYTKRNDMSNPTYDESLVIYEGIFEANTAYTISFKFQKNNTSGATNLQFHYTDGTNGSLMLSELDSGWTSASFTSSALKTLESIKWTYSSGKTYLDLDTLQIEKGTQATSYEPFISQTKKINLGKNLVQITPDTKSSFGIDYVWDADGTVSLSGTATAVSATEGTSDYPIKLKAGTTYTLSANNNQINSGVIVRFALEGGTVQTPLTLADVNRKITWTQTTDANAKIQVRVASGTSFSSPFIIKPQLEVGLTTTDFAPYFTPIELAKIGTYQDYIFNDNGTWKIHKAVGKVVLDGTETGWGYNSNNKVFWGRNSDLLPNSGFTSSTTGYWAKMSNNFTYHAQSGNNASLPDGLYENTSATHPSQLLFHYSAITSLADWQTWLGTHKPTVYYQLATPTDTTITNQALIDQLNAIENAYLYTGINNISNSSVNLAGDIDLGYTLIYEKENIIIPQTSVRLTLTDGGVINVCGCRQNVQLGMRETIQ